MGIIIQFPLKDEAPCLSYPVLLCLVSVSSRCIFISPIVFYFFHCKAKQCKPGRKLILVNQTNKNLAIRIFFVILLFTTSIFYNFKHFLNTILHHYMKMEDKWHVCLKPDVMWLYNSTRFSDLLQSSCKMHQALA